MEPALYKAAYGGRASAKSWFFADLHLYTALTKPGGGYRALCLRQVQKSIRESLKFLLEQRICFWGLGDEFKVLETRIEGPGGGEFVFHGLEGVTAESVKSFEGFDVADVEEGQMIKERPWELLVPTIIRKPGAQIWARWNPRYKTDTIDKYFRSNPPPNSIIVECNYKDNPYIMDNQLMLEQIEADFENDPEKAEHIWNGGYEFVSEASYYARQLVKMEKQGHRTSDARWNPAYPVTTTWDIGVDDYTAVWFWQFFKDRVHLIDFYETQNIGIQQIAADLLRGHQNAHPFTKPYQYEEHVFPHDVRVREWGAGAKKRIQIARGEGFNPSRAGSRLGPEERVEATRALLPICYFADTQAVQVGWDHLLYYRRKFQESTGQYSGPDKSTGDDHAADAFGEGALNCPVNPKEVLKKRRPKVEHLNDYREMGETAGDSSWL